MKKGYDPQDECNHHFEYSHQESVPSGYGTANMKDTDVTVCSKCGLVRRS